MKINYITPALLTAGFIITACNPSAADNSKIQTITASTQTVDIAATKQNLIAFNDRFNDIAANYDMDAFLSLYASDALWIAPGERPVAGLGEQRKTFGFLSSNKGTLSHTVDTLHISDDGTQATMIGGAVIKVEAAGLDATGTYLFVLERTENGANDWKIVTDMFHQHTVK